MGAPKNSGDDCPNDPEDGRTSGSIDAGTPNHAQSSSLHAIASMSYSIVRDAFVGSVACTAPPVRRQINQVSIVPAISDPERARSASDESFRIHSSFVAEKYGSTTRPVFAVM